MRLVDLVNQIRFVIKDYLIPIASILLFIVCLSPCHTDFVTVQVKCEACKIGSFSNMSLATSCWNCEPPMYSDVASGATACVLCGAGSESVQHGNDGAGGFKCTLCAPGSFRYAVK